MKIAIITFHKAENFGSALQAFAMTKTLQKLGHQVSIIDFVLESDMAQYRLFRTHLYKVRKRAFLGDLLYLHRNMMRKRNFYSFRQRFLNLTSKTYYEGMSDLSELNDSFDAFVCGSDQIWNLNCTNGIVPEYFLSFVNKEKLKVALAPSMPSSINSNYYNKLKTYIDRLDYVSVRENQTVDYLNREVLVSKKIFHAVDPTLLLTTDEYIDAFSVKKKDSQPYIFVYILGDSEQNPTIVLEANRVQHITGYKINYVFMRRLEGFQNSEYCFGIGPEEFLNMIYNAEYVITDSFHATVFSVIFSKRLCVFPRGGSASRMREFLQALNLSINLYKPNNDLWIKEDIRKRIPSSLEQLAAPTKEYIDKIFG